VTARSISVVKFGRSVLTDPQAFRRVAAFVADLLAREPNHQSLCSCDPSRVVPERR
jgi:hypothetical protein